MRHLLFLTVSATALAFGATAQAACVSAFPNVTCSGTTTGGFTDPTSGLIITVAPGATVENPGGDGFRVRGDTISLTNNGTIEASGDAIDSEGGTTGFTLVNTGTMTSGGRGLDARPKANVAVTNSGTIAAGNDGIDTGNGATITNSGTITMTSADSKAIDVGNGSTVTNSGTIESGFADVEGIETGNNSTITNSGIIRVTDDALNPGERITVTNSGIIEATGTGDGIDIDSGTITNEATGQILSANSSGIDYDASVVAISTIDNSGLIRGAVGVEVELGLGVDPANTVGQHVINRSGGTIQGTGGTALVLGAGMDMVHLFEGSSLIGLTDLGDDDDLLRFSGTSFLTGSFGSLFDGGPGTDTVQFDFSVSNITSILFSNDILTFSFLGLDALDGLRLTRFETFVFANQSFDQTRLLEEFGVNATPIPLPAGVWLMLGALAGLAGLKRRRTA